MHTHNKLSFGITDNRQPKGKPTQRAYLYGDSFHCSFANELCAPKNALTQTQKGASPKKVLAQPSKCAQPKKGLHSLTPPIFMEKARCSRTHGEH